MAALYQGVVMVFLPQERHTPTLLGTQRGLLSLAGDHTSC